jgi:hypothetical protein
MKGKKKVARQSKGPLLLKRTWEKRILILLITFLCTAGSLVYSLFVATPRYDSTAKITVSSSKGESKLLEKDYKEIVSDDKLLAEAAEKSDSDYTVKQLKNKVSVEVPKNTRVVSIIVRDKDPQVASELADSVRELAVTKIKEMTKSEDVSTLEDAEVPRVPSFPNIPLYALLATAIGFVLSLIGAVVFELLDDRIKSPEDVEEGMDVVFLGVIPEINLGKK